MKIRALRALAQYVSASGPRRESAHRRRGRPEILAGAPGGCHLIDLRAEHQHPIDVRRQLDALGLPQPVARGVEPRLIATLATPRGTVELA